jgi:very-short-patch-repair endonuclease
MRTSNKKYLIYCSICKHTFSTTAHNFSVHQACSFCTSRILCEDDTCTICFNKSFASCDLANYWCHDKNSVSPRQIFKGTEKKYWLTCNVCKHDFEMDINSMVRRKRGCSYCSHTKLCDSIDCSVCHNNSFASSDMVVYWSKKNMVEPRMIFKSSSQKFIFDCPNCNDDFISALNSIAGGQWCGCTHNKTETKLWEYLRLKYDNITITKQKKFDWCKNILFLPFDICMEEYKLIIEIDGLQHFKQVRNWNSPEKTQESDKYKMLCALKQGYSIIRIFQEDVWDNKNNWEINLQDAIIKVKNITDKPTHIFIGEIYKTKYFKLDF